MKRWVVGLAALVLSVAVYLYFVNRAATEDSLVAGYVQGDLTGTLHRIAKSQDLDPSSMLLAANCFRQLGSPSQFEQWIERARTDGAAADEVELALALNKIQNGQLDGSPQELIDVLQSAGALPSDARSVVVLGSFAAGRFEDARQLLSVWALQQPDSAQRSYLSAVDSNINGEAAVAEAKLIETIDRHPDHELASLALSEFYSRPPNVRFGQAELVLEHMVKRFPHNSEVRLRLAKVQRRLGRTSIAALQDADPASEVVAIERAKIEFDQGKTAESIDRLKSLGLVAPRDFNRLTDSAFQMSLSGRGESGGELTHQVGWMATALALGGERATASEVFDVAADRTARLRRLQDLEIKRALFPRQQAFTDEANAIVSPAYTPAYPTLAQLAEPPIPAVPPDAVQPGLQLYQTHCAICHGVHGDGLGLAADNLFPAPRNFRDEPIRLVSTENRIPTDTDLARTIRLGEAGTSMPAFSQLGDTEIQSLVDLLRSLIAAGLRERYLGEFDHAEGAQEAAAEWVLARSEPGPTVSALEFSGSDAKTARGREVFHLVGCGGCHAMAEEPATSRQRLFDSLGRPVRAPRLDADPFHGGQGARELYLRIVLGIPGTPHPALAHAPAADIEALVAYIQSVCSTSAPVSTNHQRSLESPFAPRK